MNPRFRRLQRDYDKLQELAIRSPFVSVQAVEGHPPEKYIIDLTCKGITQLRAGNSPVYSQYHQLGIHLHDEYPRKGPNLQMLTPVWHPNIASNGLVCYGDEGDHGWAPAMGLDDLIVRVIQIIRYENIGLNSPFNTIAARWAAKHQSLFPLEQAQIVGEDLPEIEILEEIGDIILIEPDSGGDDLDIVIL